MKDRMQRIGYGRLWSVTLWLAFGWALIGCQTAPIESDFGAGKESLTQLIVSTLGAWGAPLLAYLILRPLAVHLVLRNMMKRAPGVEAVQEIPVQQEETTSETQLQLLEVDRSQNLRIEGRLRERVDRAMKTGRRTWNIFISALSLFTLTALVIWADIVWPRMQAGPADAVGVGFSAIAVGILAESLPIIIVAGALFLLGFAYAGYKLLGRLAIPSSVGGLLLLAAMWIVAGVVLEKPLLIFLLPPFTAMLILVRGFRKIYAAVKDDGNLQLFVLRVFGADRNTASVFGNLIRKWQHVGSFITIVDPTYMRYQFSLSSPESRFVLLRIVAGCGILISAFALAIQAVWFVTQGDHSPLLDAWRGLGFAAQKEIMGVIVWLVLIPLSLLPVLNTIRRRFLDSAGKLKMRVQAISDQQLKWNTVFPGYPIYCFDNVWREAVRSLLKVSDAVLMDLRGFTPERIGCEYEIGLLLDSFPLSRTVFLVDFETKQNVVDLIRRRARYMSQDSPNRVEKLTLKLYSAGDDDEKDIPGIIGLLAASARAEPDSQPPTTIAATKSRRFLYFLRRSIRQAGKLLARIPIALDMMIAKPSYSKLVAPLLLLTLVTYLWFRVAPVVRDFQAYLNLP